MARKKTKSAPAILNDKYELVAASRLKNHPRNARRGDQAAITASIRENGFYGALIVQRSTSHILVGNHRFRGAVEVGIEKVPVIWVDVDDVRATKIALADNRTNDLADYDEKVLAAELQSLPDLAGTGYEAADLAKLLKSLEVQQPPDDFRRLDDTTVTTLHKCPKCGFEFGPRKNQRVEGAPQKA